MKTHLNIFGFVIILCMVFIATSGCEDNSPVAEPALIDTTFVAEISQVWIDTVTNRKITLANVAGSNHIFGTDHWLGDSGSVNIQGFLNNFKIQYTVIIQNQPPGYSYWYIDYIGELTDTSSNNKRMTVRSSIDTLYLKVN